MGHCSKAIPLVRAQYLIGHVRAYCELGGDADRLVTGLGVPEDVLQAPVSHIPLVLLERFVLAAFRDVGLALVRQAAPRSLQDLGMFGQQLARSPTLHDALTEFVRRVGAEASQANFFLERRPRTLWVCRGAIPSQGPMLLHTERYNVLFLLTLVRHWAGADWLPSELWLQGDPVVDEGELASIEKVRFRAPLLAFPVPERLVYRASRTHLGSPDVRGAVAPESLDRLSFVESLERVVETYLPGGSPRIERIASLLGTSPRSLQRQLSGAGTAYSRIVADVRRSKAVQQLSGSSRTITEIAGDLGYSDPAHFARAFRGWLGIGPREFRRLNCADGSPSSGR